MGAIKQIPSRREILSQPKALEALNRLAKSPLDKEKLIEKLLVLLRVPPKTPNHLVPRRSDRQTKLLPIRLENLADEIQQANDRSGLLYEIELEAHSEITKTGHSLLGKILNQPAGQSVDVFRSLPLDLRTYADYLRYVIKVNRKGWSELHDFAIWNLQQYIKETTGHYHDEDLATLLTAAFRAADQEAVAKRFNETQLKALRSKMTAKYTRIP